MASYDWPQNIVVRRMTPQRGKYTGARGLSTLADPELMSVSTTRREGWASENIGDEDEVVGRGPSSSSRRPRSRGTRGTASSPVSSLSSASTSPRRRGVVASSRKGLGDKTAAGRASVAHAAALSQKWGASLTEGSSR